MKKSLLRKIVAIASIGFFVALGSIYAAFGKIETSDDLGFNVGTQTGSIIDVANQIELATNGQYETFNSVINITDPTDRKKIRLTSDIILTEDLIITADSSLDLNGFTINLNSFDLYIRHNFYGSLIIENGTLADTSGLGLLRVQTPNATPEIANVTNASQFIVVEQFEPSTVAQIIFAQAQSVLEQGPAGKYHYKDVILPHNYYNSDIEFAYSSSHATIFTNTGKVYSNLVASEQEVTVSLDLTIAGQTYTDSYAINIVPITNQTKWLEIAADLLVEYLEPNYVTESSSYQVSKSIMLIPENEYIGVTYDYTAINDGVVDSSIITTGSSVLNVLLIAQDVVLQVVPKFSASVYLNPARELILDFVAPMTKYDIATYVVSETFGSFIFFNDLGISKSLIDIADFSGMGIVNLNYSMSQVGYYMLNTSANTITSIADSSGLNVYLNIVFTFDDTTTVLRRVRTVFDQVGEVDPFDGYYNLIREMFRIRTNDHYTYNSFYLPSFIELDGIQYTLNYEIASIYPTLPVGSENLMVITYDGANNRYALTIDKAKIPIDNSTYGLNILYRLSTSDPLEPMSVYGTQLGFIIPGVVRNNAAGIPVASLYNAIDSVFNNDTNRSYGLLLRDSLSQNLDLVASGLGISNFKGIELLINLRSLDISNNSFGTNSSNLTYLSALTNLVTLNISNNSITSFATQISLTRLTTLDISRNTISFTNFPNIPIIENLNLSYNRLASVATIPDFANLETLNISNNSIQYFYFLEKFDALTSLYTYNNGTYNTTNQTYGTNFSVLLYNVETLIYMNYDRGTTIYATSTTATNYTETEKTRSQVLRGILFVDTVPTSVTTARVTTIMNQLPTSVISYGGTTHTLSYIYHSTTLFLSQYVSGGVVLQRVMLIYVGS